VQFDIAFDFKRDPDPLNLHKLIRLTLKQINFTLVFQFIREKSYFYPTFRSIFCLISRHYSKVGCEIRKIR
jgi:hypothetical protein